MWLLATWCRYVLNELRPGPCKVAQLGYNRQIIRCISVKIEEGSMTQAQSAEEKARVKKQWTDLAIQQALASQWEEAVITNKNILSMFPNQPEAYNRLGKAYSQLRQSSASRHASSHTLTHHPL